MLTQTVTYFWHLISFQIPNGSYHLHTDWSGPSDLIDDKQSGWGRGREGTWEPGVKEDLTPDPPPCPSQLVQPRNRLHELILTNQHNHKLWEAKHTCIVILRKHRSIIGILYKNFHLCCGLVAGNTIISCLYNESVQ